MAETVSGCAELDRHEGVPYGRQVKAVAVPKDVINDILARDLWKVLIDQEPLVVPQSHLASDEELHVGVGEVPRCLGRQVGQFQIGKIAQHTVVKQDVSAVETSYDHVFVVARVPQRAV